MTIVLQSLCILQGKFLYVITSVLLDMLHVAGVKTETLTLAKTAILNISASTFFFMEQKKTIRFQPCWSLDNGNVFHTVPAPKTISCSLTSLNTDGTIAQTHTKGPKKNAVPCCTVHNVSVISTIAPFFLRGATLQTV